MERFLCSKRRKTATIPLPLHKMYLLYLSALRLVGTGIYCADQMRYNPFTISILLSLRVLFTHIHLQQSLLVYEIMINQNWYRYRHRIYKSVSDILGIEIRRIVYFVFENI